MKIDLLLDPFATSWSAVLEVAQAADELGYDGLWTWDHLAGEVHGVDRVLECWTVLSALAGRTTRVSLGPLVLNVANRRPGVMAVMAATLQEVSGGRLVLGLGAGGDRATPYWREQAALGLDVPPDPVRRQQLTDAVAVCRQVWSGRTEEAAWPTQRLGEGTGFLPPDPPPPIVVGGFGPRMAELAGTVADGFNTQAGHPQLDQLVDAANRARDRSSLAGQPFELSGFAGLDPAWVDRGRDRLDRLVMIVSPGQGVGPIERLATTVGLEP